MSITRRKCLYTIVIDIVLICATLCMFLLDTSDYKLIFIFGTIVFTILMSLWIVDVGQVVNYFSILIALIYLYSMGQYLLCFFDIDIKFQYNIYNTYQPVQINGAVLYVLINTIILHLSTIIFMNQRGRYRIERESTNEEQKAFRITSIVVLNISFICKLIVLLFKIRLNLRYGYSIALGTSYN